MFKDIAVYHPTCIVMVPALAELGLTLSKKFNKNMFGEDMKTIICGAAAVPAYLIEEYAKIGIELLGGYGLTESANLVSGNPESRKNPTSVGLMYPDQEYRIVDGELQLKGDNMMDGYVGSDEDNKNAYEDGWFRTGDLVRMDEEGFLYIVGRIKEIIVLGTGENISPAELEEKFNALTTVQCSQVFEAVGESGKHILALEVVPRLTELAKLHLDDPNAYLMTELKKINEALPSYQKVSRIVIRDTDFERTPAMKIKRYKLQ
jgi:long-chain acyl-CoA synthetase